MKYIALFLAIILAFSAVKAEKTKEVIDTIEGILIGAFEEHGKAAVTCVEDGETTFVELEEAIKELAKGTTVSIIEGLYHIGKALEKLPEEFKDCTAAEDLIPDLEHVVDEFKDPKELVVHVGTEILWHGKSIYKDITGAVADFNEGDFMNAGVNVGDIIHILLVQKVLNYLGNPAQEAIDTVEGILVGAFGDEGKQAVVCLEDGEAIVIDIEKAVKEFEQGGVTHIVQGLYYIGEALEELPKEFQGCEAAEGLLDDFEVIIEEFKDPKDLAVHVGKEILWHGKNIYNDIKGAETHFKAAEYEPAGENVGDIVKILFIDTVENLIKNSL